jgi:hypothetical protein
VAPSGTHRRSLKWHETGTVVLEGIHARFPEHKRVPVLIERAHRMLDADG